MYPQSEHIYREKSGRVCNDTDKDVTKNIMTTFSNSKWLSSMSFKIRLIIDIVAQSSRLL
jgi:hypothetical protein